VTGQRSSHGEAYWRGYERGVQAGHTVGYQEGVSVLDDAAGVLAQLRPSRTVAMAAGRARLAEGAGPSLTPQQLRAQAAESWGLPVPANLVDLADAAGEQTSGPTDPAADTPTAAADVGPAVAELADDDDWAWQL
jgi:hypothetical protein